jgi:hypothetical protein
MLEKKYRIREKFNKLSKEDYDLATKVCPKELGISEKTFYRDLNGEGDDIPHIRFVQYCQFLQLEDQELEAFDRKDLKVRPFTKIKKMGTAKVILEKFNLAK